MVLYFSESAFTCALYRKSLPRRLYESAQNAKSKYISQEVIMDYSKEYAQKLVSADEAVKTIKSGDWVDYGWCNATVDALDKALAKRTDELTNVNLRGGILLKTPAVFEREDA